MLGLSKFATFALATSMSIILNPITYFFQFANAIDKAKDLDDEDEDDADDSKPTEAEVPSRPSNWVNTVYTTDLWKLVSKEDATKTDDALENYLFANPAVAAARSEDGRGGIFWAWEYQNAHALAALKAYNSAVDPLTTDEEMKDANGLLPSEMCKSSDDDDLDEETKTDAAAAASDKKTLSKECKALLTGIDSKVEEILARKKEKEEAVKKSLEKEVDELDEDDDGDKSNDMDMDDDDDDAVKDTKAKPDADDL